MSEKIYIKNMVCPRCISAVESILNQLQVNYREVRLGEVDLDAKLNLSQLNKLSEKLKNQGFQLIQDHKTSLVERIKALVIDRIHYSSKLEDSSWATYLNKHLHLDYKYLSSLFLHKKI